MSGRIVFLQPVLVAACLTGSYDPPPAATDHELNSSSITAGEMSSTSGLLTAGVTGWSESSTTSQGVCGDGIMDAPEACDDGNQVPDDGCENDCTVSLPVCGDSRVEGEEECDDGNGENTDSCVNCSFSSCGDGYVQVGVEQCDNGPNNVSPDTAAPTDCTTACVLACGDGVAASNEECDDANQIDDDDCSNDCVAPRIVFVTSFTNNGDWGGLAGADSDCEVAALGLGQPNSQWYAWLGNGILPPALRMDTDFQGYYKLTDGSVVAHGWIGLTSGSLVNPIAVTEQGNVIGLSAVWTNATQVGENAGVGHCQNWTSGDPGLSGRTGSAGYTDMLWTESGFDDCSKGYRLYCFEN